MANIVCILTVCGLVNGRPRRGRSYPSGPGFQEASSWASLAPPSLPNLKGPTTRETCRRLLCSIWCHCCFRRSNAPGSQHTQDVLVAILDIAARVDILVNQICRSTLPVDIACMLDAIRHSSGDETCFPCSVAVAITSARRAIPATSWSGGSFYDHPPRARTDTRRSRQTWSRSYPNARGRRAAWFAHAIECNIVLLRRRRRRHTGRAL